MPKADFIRLATITAAHGVRGQVKIHSFTTSPENITAYGAIFTDERGENEIKLKITGQAKGQLIASIDGITDRNQAQRLKGVGLFVPRCALPATAEDEFYREDLIGMRVVDAQGEDFGIVTAVDNYGAGDIITVTRSDDKRSEEAYIFSKELFPDIDMAAGVITINPPQVIYATADADEE